MMMAGTTLDINRILATHIPDIAPVYGGVRGRTMSLRHQSYAWPIIRDAGIHTIIDLREDSLQSSMQEKCAQNGMRYFYYPVDNRCNQIESMVKLFPELCRHIDEGNFYIACAMGLHRTDIALCTYWVFYGADRGLEPPQIRGYHEASGHNTSKIMRVLNAVYSYMTEHNGQEPMSMLEFKRRKDIIKKQRDNIMKKNNYKICFVCTGNACRSPFAECVTNVFLNKEGLDNIEVYSCGTLDWGENPRDEGMYHVAKLMGYELTGVTISMTRDLLEKADLIIVFETKHRNEITRVLDYNQWNKISLFNQLAFGENKDMEDPHMQSESTYKRIATQIEKGCEQLVQHMKMEIL